MSASPSSKAEALAYLPFYCNFRCLCIGSRVLWTRLMGMLLLGTVYVFSVILAVFLIGLAIGGGAASWIIRRVRPALHSAGHRFCWPRHRMDGSDDHADSAVLAGCRPHHTNPWQMYLLDFKRCVFAILPPTLLWGASFPLACAAALRSRDEDPGRVAGAVYAANTLGAIVGALAVSLI